MWTKLKDGFQYLVACSIVVLLCVVVVSACVVLRPVGWLLEWEARR